MKKKIIMFIVVLLIISLGVLSILYFNGNLQLTKKEKKVSSGNMNDYNVGESQQDKEEYYQLYFENGKIYFSLNEKDKKYLMDDISTGQRPYYYIYGDDKLYYYYIDSQDNNGSMQYTYNFNYIDLNTLKKSDADIKINTDIYVEFNFVQNDNIYYSYSQYRKNEETGLEQQEIAIKKYNLNTKKHETIIQKSVKAKKTGGSNYFLPKFTIYNNVMYAIMADDETLNLVTVVNGKEEVLFKNAITYQNPVVLDNKIYFGNDKLYSYDLKTKIVSTEQVSNNTNIYQNILIFSDMIAYTTQVANRSVNSVCVKTANLNSCIDIKLNDNTKNILATDLRVNKRIDKNRIRVSDYNGFGFILDLNKITNIPASEGGGIIAYIDKIITPGDAEFDTSDYSYKYLEYRR